MIYGRGSIRQCFPTPFIQLNRELSLLHTGLVIDSQKQEAISMASKSDFTPEEWKTIVAAVPMVGLAVTCASRHGV